MVGRLRGEALVAGTKHDSSDREGGEIGSVEAVRLKTGMGWQCTAGRCKLAMRSAKIDVGRRRLISLTGRVMLTSVFIDGER